MNDPTFKTGQRLFGPNETPLVVASIDITADQVMTYHPTTLKETVRTVAEVEQWKKSGLRRIYYPDNYLERRVKVYDGPDLDTHERVVRYQLPEQGLNLTTISGEEWDSWRHGLPDTVSYLN